MFNLGNAKKSYLSKKEEENKYYVDDYECDLSNDNDSHTIIIKSIKGDNKKILDVGCGVGYIGRKLKELGNYEIDGIEIDKEAYKIVKEYYDNVYNFSIEDFDDSKYKEFFSSEKKYDYIIFADLLEHLSNPGLIVSQLYKKLSKNGKFIISIPNISHIDIISNLINGKFNYNETGILDSTHLRFFTENSFYDFISNVSEKYNIGLDVKLVGKTYAKENDKNDKFLFDVLDMDCYVFQNIFEITKINEIKSKKKKTKNNYKKINDIYIENINKINEYEKTINENSAELNNLKRQLDDSLKLNRDYEQELNNIKNSRSWKLTKPLRKIKGVFK